MSSVVYTSVSKHFRTSNSKVLKFELLRQKMKCKFEFLLSIFNFEMFNARKFECLITKNNLNMGDVPTNDVCRCLGLVPCKIAIIKRKTRGFCVLWQFPTRTKCPSTWQNWLSAYFIVAKPDNFLNSLKAKELPKIINSGFFNARYLITSKFGALRTTRPLA